MATHRFDFEPSRTDLRRNLTPSAFLLEKREVSRPLGSNSFQANCIPNNLVTHSHSYGSGLSASLRSDRSRGRLIDFKETPSDLNYGSGLSSASLRSDRSRGRLIDFKETPSNLNYRSGLSSASLRSDRSRGRLIDFKETPSDLNFSRDQDVSPGQVEWKSHDILKELEKRILTFVEKELKKIHKVLESNDIDCFLSEKEGEEERRREAFLQIALDFLRLMGQDVMAEYLLRSFNRGVCHNLKRILQKKLCCVFEDVDKTQQISPQHQIYTELRIEEGETSVNEEHEFISVETAPREKAIPATTIACEDIFKGPVHKHGSTRTPQSESKHPSQAAEHRAPVRTVLTKGAPGIGKTVLTQKFIINWAKGNTNQDIHLLFPFTLREINLLRDREFSLIELLHYFFNQTFRDFEHLKVLFIFDGLDESRLSLDFTKAKLLTDPSEAAPVNVILINLIRGTLLPSAHIWITTRPTAAKQIPAKYVCMVTEIQGFNNLQKEEYFKKMCPEEATDIISYLKSHSLYSMCYFPLFCWIISKALHDMKSNQNPQTMTQLYICFLVVQVKKMNYECSEHVQLWTPETRNLVISLGKLAFEQLQKGNVIFYEEDLIECGLNTEKLSSGGFTQIFKEERGWYQDQEIYSFTHLSIQEFLAALYVHHTYFCNGVNLFTEFQMASDTVLQADSFFYQSVIDEVFLRPNGHLDLFLRFLLGLSLLSNKRQLQGLLPQTDETTEMNQETIKYIHQKIEEGLSAERTVYLFYCLKELNDHTLVTQIDRRGNRLSEDMSPAQWSAVAFLLLSSDADLEVFDLKKYCPSEKVLLRLLPVVKASNKAIMACCSLSASSCGYLSTVLCAPLTCVTLLDLSNNDLKDSGVEQLCSGLKNPICKLQILKLSGCLISDVGGTYLASALNSNPSYLRELDLSYNHLGPSAKLLTSVQDSRCSLESLRMKPDGPEWLRPGLWKYSCTPTLDPDTANASLSLSKNKSNNQTVTHVSVRHQQHQRCPDVAKRFTLHPQVLCSTGLTGRCYWEVDWRGKDIFIAMSYRGISRDDSLYSAFRYSEHFWGLRIYYGKYTVCHNKSETEVFSSLCSNKGRVGVYLDSDAGTLSFYIVRNRELFHLHTFNNAFAKPLFPGFALFNSSVSLVLPSVELLQLMLLSPQLHTGSAS